MEGPLLVPRWGPAMTGPGDALLTVRDLHLSFRAGGRKGGRIQALRGVNLEVLEGECLALVGESGSGKTTLARCILNLLSPTRGRVLYRGVGFDEMSREELGAFRRKAQIVFQDPFGSLNPRLRAGEMLSEVLRVRRKVGGNQAARKKVEEILALVGLPPDAASRFPHEFSGGQRQRLGIARSLSVEPEFLVLDEPVSALDLSVQAQILNLLEELRRSLGLTYLFVTHDLSVVRHVADRVAVQYLGRVVETGPTEDLFSDPLHPYTRGLLAAAEITPEQGVPREWALIPGDPPSPLHPPTGCALHPRCPHPSKDGECRVEEPLLSPRQGPRKAACIKVGKHLIDP